MSIGLTDCEQALQAILLLALCTQGYTKLVTKEPNSLHVNRLTTTRSPHCLDGGMPLPLSLTPPPAHVAALPASPSCAAALELGADDVAGPGSRRKHHSRKYCIRQNSMKLRTPVTNKVEFARRCKLTSTMQAIDGWMQRHTLTILCSVY